MTAAEEQRIERLLSMAQRLIEALECDVTQLKSGKTGSLRTIDPEIVRLSALYGREAAALTAQAAKSTRPDLVNKLTEATARFRALLEMQLRLLTRMRSASEGMIHAVAEEIERRRAPTTPYRGLGRAPSAARPMLINSVA